MELGEKIKQARLEAGLSQRQLCGDTITRNMLSLIENGTARPSMDTLRHIARQLDKPMSYFLEEDAVTSPNQPAMADARQCFGESRFQNVLDALSGYRAPDPVFDSERGLLVFLSLLELARQAVADRRIPYARSLLARAGQEQSLYITPALEQQRLVLLGKTGEPVALSADEILLVQAQCALSQDCPEQALTCLAAAQDTAQSQWQLLSGLAHFALADYAAALPHLTAAESDYPKETVPRLEVCHRELGDYKHAYEYACKGR